MVCSKIVVVCLFVIEKGEEKNKGFCIVSGGFVVVGGCLSTKHDS